MVVTPRPAAIFAGILMFASLSAAFAQTDPGVRPGAINGQTGATATSPLPLPSVQANPNALAFFNDGLNRFQEVDTINGTHPGLGPRFNLNECAACHAQPTIGGTGLATNPQFTAISRGVASQQDTMPSFITANGPTREARFPFFFNGSTPNTAAPNGGVETIFTVSNLSGAGGCNIAQPPFATAVATNNIIFRIPTPVFGAGLLENVDDSALYAVQLANQGNGMGVSGTFNHNGNDGTIARFGWKAQNKSLLLFSGEAYNVEMGITNELFPQDRPLPEEEQTHPGGLVTSCLNLGAVGYPEDITNFGQSGPATLSDIEGFAQFMRLLAPPTPSTTTPGGATSISNGKSLFSSVGCSFCHTPSLTTNASQITSSLGNATIAPYSDLEIHHMGTGLADNVSQGAAGGDQFRTSPLWGLGQRIFFLHDGRTTNVLTAISAHSSNGSEANTIIGHFNSLTASQKQDLVNFLRSL
jgi:CxxC motif-containing protein (DUF1111 family)